MKITGKLIHLVALIMLPLAARAQFTSGSDGSYGAMNITANTSLQVPADGIFHCTTINVASGVTLQFEKNPRNTPVYLLASGDVTIAGAIDVSGRPGTNTAGGAGGPGGFDGGSPGFGSEVPPGAGYGPGGGKGGARVNGSNDAVAVGGGSFGSAPTAYPTRPKNGAVYGTRLLIPIIGGSGSGGTTGNPGVGGGGGGGALLIASSTRITVSNTAILRANGAWANTFGSEGAGGSGGAIRLVAPTVTGAGQLHVFGAVADGSNQNTGGNGRTRIDAIDRSASTISGVQTYGSAMVVFPTPKPSLSVVQAAGTEITEGSGVPVSLLLPNGTPTTQPVKVRARDFGVSVPIRVAVIPESGDPTFTDATIDNVAANPAEATVNVAVPVNLPVKIQVWTR